MFRLRNRHTKRKCPKICSTMSTLLEKISVKKRREVNCACRESILPACLCPPWPETKKEGKARRAQALLTLRSSHIWNLLNVQCTISNFQS